MDNCSTTNELTKNICVLDAIKWIAKSWSEILQEKTIYCFRKAGFIIPSSENDHESTEQLAKNEVQILINDLKCLPTHEKIIQSDYVSLNNAMCITEANTSVDSLI